MASSGREAQLGDARPARVAVVDHDGGQPGVVEERGGDAAHVPAVADGEQRQDPDGGVLGGVEEAGEEGAGRKPIAFVAASLLVTVILMHVLWLKREVEKGLVLPAEDPA